MRRWYTGVEDRRHTTITHLAKAISVHDFRNQIEDRLSEVKVPLYLASSPCTEKVYGTSTRTISTVASICMLKLATELGGRQIGSS